MGKAFSEELGASHEVFRTGSEVSGFDLERLCFEGPLDELTRTDVQQPALVTASIACLRAVEQLGLEVAYVVGHSVGEYSALAACGALSARDAIALAAVRARATSRAATERPGIMAAVLGLDDGAVEELCSEAGDVWPANYNCPGQVVVSGTPAAVELLQERASEAGARRVIPLRVTGAFHSPLVAEAAPEVEEATRDVAWQRPRTPFFSTVTGSAEPLERLPGLLVEQLTAPVRFTQSVSMLSREGVDLFVEVGPGHVLTGLVRRIDRSVQAISVGDPSSLAKLQEVLADG